MQLYISVFLTSFRKRNPDNQPSLTTYENMTNKLNAVSKELWFFDNEPTTYDIQHSDSVRLLRKHKQLTENNATVIYYDNPAERLRNLRYVYP